jgi:hypothetical protein
MDELALYCRRAQASLPCSTREEKHLFTRTQSKRITAGWYQTTSITTSRTNFLNAKDLSSGTKSCIRTRTSKACEPPESSTQFVVKSSKNSQQRDKKAASAGIYLDGIKGE